MTRTRTLLLWKKNRGLVLLLLLLL